MYDCGFVGQTNAKVRACVLHSVYASKSACTEVTCSLAVKSHLEIYVCETASPQETGSFAIVGQDPLIIMSCHYR